MKTYPELVAEAKTRVREVTVEQVLQQQAKGEDVVYVDVREESEWDAGHMPGAVHLGRGVLEVKVNQVFPDPATPLVLYCAGGNRSALAADVLQVMGYSNVASMIGGWRAWTQAGGETERGDT
ncbi:MAG: rhodanese-like domain-containing protein [Candidatus Eisenbacteria bacterium]